MNCIPRIPKDNHFPFHARRPRDWWDILRDVTIVH
jgi:hypothetical protein